MSILSKILDWVNGLFESPAAPPFYPPQDPDDIRSYRSTKDILRSGRFTPAQRAAEYRRRGKAPAGVIDGEYNDTYLEDGVYNDTDRDWDADA